MELSVVIPVFNEAENISVLHKRLSEVIQKITLDCELFFVAGWTSLMLVILFTGIQLLSIGTIGEYISRIGANVRNCPLYIVEETHISKK